MYLLINPLCLLQQCDPLGSCPSSQGIVLSCLNLPITGIGFLELGSMPVSPALMETASSPHPESFFGDGCFINGRFVT